MALCARQLRFYAHRCDIWKRTDTQDADGILTGETWAKIASAVPCYFDTGESFETPTPYGRDEGDNMFTVDHVYFDVDQDVDAGYWLINKTTHRNGTASAHYNRAWVCQGQAQSVPAHPTMTGERREILATQKKKVPTGITIGP